MNDQDNAAATDAVATVTVRHIEQLSPVLKRNSDVIAMMFAGFIGPWGEWHHSSSGNLTADDHVNEETQSIFRALMNVAPDRFIGLRHRTHKRELLGTDPVNAANAFMSDSIARVGFHDEAFLQNRWGNEGQSNWFEEYVRAEGPFTPSFEAFDSNAITEGTVITCSQMTSELAKRNSDFVTDLRDQDRFDRQCEGEIQQRVGYRYRLLESNIPSTANAGDTLNISVRMVNEGWGNLFNQRSVEVILRNTETGDETRIPGTLPKDLRMLLPSAGETATFDLRALLPAGLLAGNYRVLLNLPDAAATLRRDPRYSIRLANQQTWEAKTGFNDLGAVIRITNG